VLLKCTIQQLTSTRWSRGSQDPGEAVSDFPASPATVAYRHGVLKQKGSVQPHISAAGFPSHWLPVLLTICCQPPAPALQLSCELRLWKP